MSIVAAAEKARARPPVAATRATYVAFIVCGFAFASWAACIPQVRDGLHLTPGALGLLLLTLAAGSVTALLLAGSVVSRLHSRRTITLMVPIEAAALAAAGLGYPLGVVPLALALFVFGFATAMWDVAMNVQGAAVERRLGRAIMPRFHAGYSVGTVGGALLGAGLILLDVSVTARLVLVAVAVALIMPVALRSFLPDLEHPPVTTASDSEMAHGKPAGVLARWREPRTLLVGIVVLAFAFAEGAGIDWISIALIDGYGLPAVIGTLGFAAFLASMTLARWFSESVLARFGRVTVIRAQAVLAIAGVALFVVSPSAPLAFAAVVLWGVGASLGFPVGMSAAADDPAAAAARVSVVASIGYCAFLAGPPLIGWLSQSFSTHSAVASVAVVLAVAGLGISSLRPIEPVAAHPD